MKIQLQKIAGGSEFKVRGRDKPVTVIDHDAAPPTAVPWWGVAYSLAIWCLLAACIIVPIARVAGGLLLP